MFKRSSNRVIFVALLMVTAIVISGTVGAEEVQSITFWHSYTQEVRQEAMNNIAKKFEEETGIHVEYEVVPWPAVIEKWTTAYAAGTLPDAMIALTHVALSMYLAGATIPADDVAENLGGKEKFLDAAIQNLTWEGNLVGVPHYGHARIFFYRRDKLEEAGLGVPQTLDEILNAARTLTIPPKQYGFVQLWNKADQGGVLFLDIFMRATGGEFFDKDFNVAFNSPESIEAVKFNVELYKAASIPGALDYRIHDQFQLINTGTTMFTMDSAFILPIAQRDAPEVMKNLGITKCPGWYTALTNAVIIDGPKKDAAKKFVAFLFRDDNYIPFLHTVTPGMNPMLKVVYEPESPYWDFQDFKTYPIFKEAVMLQSEGLAKGHEGGMKYGPNPFATILHTGIFEEMFHEIVLDNVPIEEAVAKAHNKLKEAVDNQKEQMGFE